MAIKHAKFTLFFAIAEDKDFISQCVEWFDLKLMKEIFWFNKRQNRIWQNLLMKEICTYCYSI